LGRDSRVGEGPHGNTIRITGGLSGVTICGAASAKGGGRAKKRLLEKRPSISNQLEGPGAPVSSRASPRRPRGGGTVSAVREPKKKKPGAPFHGLPISGKKGDRAIFFNY